MQKNVMIVRNAWIPDIDRMEWESMALDRKNR